MRIERDWPKEQADSEQVMISAPWLYISAPLKANLVP